MMGNVIQIPSTDGCVYMYDLVTGKTQKLCDLQSPQQFPDDVKEAIAKLQRLTVMAGCKLGDIGDMLKNILYCEEQDGIMYCFDREGRLITFPKPEVFTKFDKCPDCIISNYIRKTAK